MENIHESNENEEVFLGKYRLLKPLGKGRFGKVYKVKDIEEDQYTLALKVESKHSDYANLCHEVKILYSLLKNGVDGIPNLFWYGTDECYRFAAFTYFENGSLESVSKSLSIDELNHWFYVSYNIIKSIHCSGIIHRDIKPAHFLKDSNQNWKLIDFGLSTYFVDDSKAFIHDYAKQSDTVIGSPKYMSVHVQKGIVPSRRDDLISLIYIYINIYIEKRYNRTLPWMNLESKMFNSEHTLIHVTHPYNELLAKRKCWEDLYALFISYNIDESILNLISTARLWNYHCNPVILSLS